jgi:drug/metabolite transporter (DMT)-like permease
VITFYFAGLSGVNSGIISTVFSTCVVFTAIIFRFKYGQELTKYDYLGCFLIITCVILISIGGTENNDDDSSENINMKYLFLSVTFALVCGLLFSMNTLNVNYIIRDVKFNPDQMNYDGNMLIGAILTPLFVNECIRSPGEFSYDAILKSNMSLCLVNLAIISFSYAMKYGKGASVQAIESMKSVV